MTGCVGIAVDRDHLDPEALQSDDHFLAQLAGAQQHHAGRVPTQWCSDAHRSLRVKQAARLAIATRFGEGRV